MNMTLACRPANPIEFASIFFVDEQHVQHELAHAIHQVRYFEENKPRFREHVCEIFFSEVEKNNNTLPAVDCVPLHSVIKVVKALYEENLPMLSTILEHYSPGQYVNYREFEDIVELTVTCLNFTTYLKTFICDRINKSPPTVAPLSNTVSYEFLENAFLCLQESPAVLPNLCQEDISDAKWQYRVNSILHAIDVFQQAEDIKLDEILGECVSQYFVFLTVKVE